LTNPKLWDEWKRIIPSANQSYWTGDIISIVFNDNHN
jgi:hypothetical protein